MVLFASTLQDRARKAGLNRSELAERAQISRQYASKLWGAKPHSTTGKPIVPDADVCRRLARAVGESPTLFLTLAGHAAESHDKYAPQVGREKAIVMLKLYDEVLGFHEDSAPVQTDVLMDAVIASLQRELEELKRKKGKK